MTSVRSAWVRPGPDAAPPGHHRRHRVVCLAYAGRGASAFAAWPGLLGDRADVLAVQLPAREERMADDPVVDSTGLRARLLPKLLPWLDGPFTLFGHCMGGLLAADLALALAASGGPLPRRLVLSASVPPWTQESLGDLAAMTDGQFVRGLRRAGALTARQIGDPAVLTMMLPAIRADYLLFESTRRGFTQPDRPPLDCELTLFSGIDDTGVDADRMRDWAALSSGPVSTRTFPGDHFFLDTAAAGVAAAVAETIT